MLKNKVAKRDLLKQNYKNTNTSIHKDSKPDLRELQIQLSDSGTISATLSKENNLIKNYLIEEVVLGMTHSFEDCDLL